MKQSPLTRLAALGQSIWLDFIRRDLMTGGELGRLIDEDGLAGMTSNPTIFDKAIGDSALYDEDIRRAAAGTEPGRVFEALAVEDVRRAADAFRPVHERTRWRDGLVSIEVSPALAYDTAATIDEARRLWRACDRPNVMIKIPGTEPGLPAIETCLAEGINVNITLLFSVERYRAVMAAWFAAVERRVSAGQPVDRLASVASFFVSRVDTLVDQKLGNQPAAAHLRGKAAIANACLAYQAFEQQFRGPRFAALARHGAQLQRPLWASTSTKDPSLPDVYYVEALLGPDTVNTLPPETLDAYRDHGDPRVRIHEAGARAAALLEELAGHGIDLAAVTGELEEDGVRKFCASYDAVVKTVAAKQKSVRAA
jgi:transaldolase